MKYKEIRMETLDSKYPKIVYVEGENLNISKMVNSIIAKCWNNRLKYKTIGHISSAMGISIRTIERKARKIGLPPRDY